MIKNLQCLKGKTTLKFCQNLSSSFDEMNYRRQSGKFQFEEDPFANEAEGMSINYQEHIFFEIPTNKATG